jgi:hypothetical protein
LIDPVLGVRRRRGADRYREQIIHVPSVPHAQVKQTGFLQAVVVRLSRESPRSRVRRTTD